jgi:hypothetical protein
MSEIGRGNRLWAGYRERLVVFQLRFLQFLSPQVPRLVSLGHQLHRLTIFANVGFYQVN